jgi:ABC-type cobalamin/Fe3+-siderophores transport system ATPase subunit
MIGSLLKDEYGDSAIKMSGAVVSYRDEVALRGISLDVKNGEFVAIIGPNGAGKTTLLRTINGMAKPVQGIVKVLGHDLILDKSYSLRKIIGYVSQAQDIDPRMPMTVREVVMIGRYACLGPVKKPGSRDWSIVDSMLELVGISELSGRPIGHLSGGEQQRVAIARCLAQEPELFLLDEPTASLDWRARVEILGLVKQVHDLRRLTTLFVTHDLGALPAACDRVIMMKDGMIWGEGEPGSVLTNENLARLYDLPVREVIDRRQRAAVA